MFCLYCGTNLPDDAVFCNKCGKPQHGSSIVQSNPSQQPSVQESSPIEPINLPLEANISPFLRPTSTPGYVQTSQQRTSYDSLPPPPQKSKRPLLIGIGGTLTAIIIITGIIIAVVSSRTPTTFTPPDTGTTLSAATTVSTVTTAPTILSAPVQISPASGTVFNNYPRATTLEWNAVPGAISYTVQIYYYQPSDTTCTNGALWGTEPGISGTSYTFDFVGAQPGCWQVWAVDATGQQGNQSPLWEFSYTQ